MVTWAIVGVFLIAAILMFTKKLPAMLALPLMAVAIAAVAGIPWNDVTQDGETVKGIQTLVFTEGSMRLASALAAVIFGSILAQFVSVTGIAEATVRKAAELGGDHPFWGSLIIGIVVAAIFTTLGGLGAVIMVGTIVLPVLLSIGIPPLIAGCTLLFGLSLGGIFNLVNWGLYTSVMGLETSDIFKFALPFGVVMALAFLVFLIVETRKPAAAWATKLETPTRPEAPKVNILAMLTPIIPILLVIILKWQIIPSFVCGLIWGLIFTFRRDAINVMTKSIVEGIRSVTPAMFLIIGIGMVVKVVFDPRVTAHIGPAVAKITPGTPLLFVVVFGILAPLALYRGPLNIWGLGFGLAGLMLNSGVLGAAALMAALMSVGQIQGVCDPTNTHNVWTANFVEVDVNDILKKTLPYVWAAAVVGLIIGAVMYV